MESKSRPLRIPAQAIEAEKALLGSILVDGQSIWSAVEILGPKPELLTRIGTQIWSAMLAVSKEDATIDVVTIRNKDPSITLDVLADLAGSVASSGAIDSYSSIVNEWRTRSLIHRLSFKIQSECADSDQGIDNLVAGFQAEILTIATQGSKKRVEEAADLARDILQNGESEFGSVPTGFRDLDEILGGGIQPHQAVVIAGRPGMGKTSLGMQIGFRVAQFSSKPSLFFSLEMSARELSSRLIAGLARVPKWRLKKGDLNPQDHIRLRSAAVSLERARVRILDRGATPLSVVAATSRTEAALNGNLSCIVIDYLQLMPGSDRKENREQNVSANMAGLKALAKELDIPVIVLSQLNRSVEARDDKRPNLSDLRESGAIEQDADIVMFVYRDGYYDKPPQTSGASEIIVRKNRDGALGTAVLHFSGETTSFHDLRTSPGRV